MRNHLWRVRICDSETQPKATEEMSVVAQDTPMHAVEEAARTEKWAAFVECHGRPFINRIEFVGIVRGEGA